MSGLDRATASVGAARLWWLASCSLLGPIRDADDHRLIRLAWIALALLTILRLALAAGMSLAPDEAYYWAWSESLAGGYLDHPPMVAYWIWAGTALAGDTALGVRLLGPISAAVGTVLLVQTADLLFPGRRVGLVAATLLNATVFASVGTVIMTPDTPLLFFWTCGLWAATRFHRSRGPGWLLTIGLFAGLALDSKYTAVLFPMGIFLWFLLVPSLRRWLARPVSWAAAALGVVAFLPVLLWNADHGCASFIKQGGRVHDWHPARAYAFLGEFVGGQIGMATPVVFLLCAVGMILALRQAWRGRDEAWTLLLCMTMPGVLLFVEHAIGGRVQANWPALVYPSAAIAAAALEKPSWRRLYRPAVITGVAMTAILYVQAVAAPFPVPPRLDITALRLRGWDDLASKVAKVARQTGASYVAADNYGLSSELAFALQRRHEIFGIDTRWGYLALRTQHQVIGLDDRWGYFDWPSVQVSGRKILFIGNAFDRRSFTSVQFIRMVERTRNGVSIERLPIYLVTARKVEMLAELLPDEDE